MKSFDRMATAAVLFIACVGVVLAVATFFLGLGSYEVEERRRIPYLPPTTRDVFVQGNWFPIPIKDESVVSSVILRDGSLDTAFRYLATKEPNRQEVPFLKTRRDLLRVLPYAGFMRDYRFLRSTTMRQVPQNSWAFSREIGLLRMDEHDRVDGWLADEGWSVQPRVCDSLRRSLLPPLDYQLSAGLFYKYDVVRGPVLLYVTEEGLYRADLVGRKIERVVSLDVPTSAFIPMGAPTDNWRTYVLTRTKVHWIDPAAGGRTGSFERPGGMPKLEESEVAPGSDGRMIVRWEIPGSRKEGTPRYHVTVLTERGEKNQEYDYAVPHAKLWPRSVYYPAAQGEWEETLKRTTGGRLYRAILAPGLSEMLRISTGTINGLDQLSGGTGLVQPTPERFYWMSLPISFILALIVARSARRRSCGWLAPGLWFLFVALFGLAGALIYGMLVGREWKVKCSCCKASISPQFTSCPRCATPSEKPTLLGIEIVQPIGSKQ